MRRDQRASGIGTIWWTTLGLGTGLVTGFMLSEWIGGVNRSRVRRAAANLRRPASVTLTPAAGARAVEVALRADPRLAELFLQATPGAHGTVELRGWVPARATRALAARVALAVPGIDRIVNRILVRGEDDGPLSSSEQITDQSA